MTTIRERANRLRTAARTLLLIGLVGIGALVWWWTSRPEPSEAPTAAAVATSANEREPAGAARPVHPAAGPGPSRSPVPDASFEVIALSLAQRADAGDTRAACRLAVELMRCQEIEDMLALTPEGEDVGQVIELGMERDGLHEEADRWAEQNIWQIRRREQCRRLPEGMHARSWELLRGAALAGEPEAMLRYARGTALETGGNVPLRHPGLDNWRREAPAMMDRAFRAGHREAILLLWFAYHSDNQPYSGLIPNDPARALALQILSSRTRGVGMPPLDRYSASQISDAIRQAEVWHIDHFGGRVMAGSKDMGKLSPLSQYDPEAALPCE